MRKRYLIPLALLAATAVFLQLNLAQGRETVAEIEGLLVKGKEEAKACQEWKKNAGSYPWSDLGAKDPPVHATKEEALSALAFVESYPAAPPSHLKAARLFREQHELLSKRVDRVSLNARRYELEGECELFFMLRHTQALLQDIKAHRLAKKDAERARAAVRSYLRQQASAESLIAIAVHAVIYQKLLEESGRPGDARLAAAAKAFLVRFEDKRQLISAAWKKANYLEHYLMSYLGIEFKLIEELGREYMALLEEARI